MTHLKTQDNGSSFYTLGVNMTLRIEVKQEIFSSFNCDKTNVGSTNIQIAFLTKRINYLQRHFTDNRKDHSSRRGLLKMVAHRRKLLNYLRKKSIESYTQTVRILGLRR